MPRTKYDNSHLKDLLGHVNPDSSVALHIQIENSVRFAIASGALKAGDRIPSVRELSEWLPVNVNTALKACHYLERMGLLHARHCIGFYVKKGVKIKCRNKCRAEIASRVLEVCSEARACGMSKTAIKKFSQDCYRLATSPYAEPSEELLACANKL